MLIDLSKICNLDPKSNVYNIKMKKFSIQYISFLIYTMTSYLGINEVKIIFRIHYGRRKKERKQSCMNEITKQTAKPTATLI